MLRGITVAVGDWYARTLAVCLPANLRHLAECVVVTSPEDHAIRALCKRFPNVHVYVTEAFREHGAIFNKGLCVELSFDFLGRHGWIMVLDADILLPDSLPLDKLRPDCLNGGRRRILENPADYRPDLDWSTLPPSFDGGPIGFAQIFHADDPAIRDKRPWYDVSFAHAGGGDAYFMFHWPPKRWSVLPFDVLHLGPKDRNWFTATPEGRDKMAAFVARNGWRHAARQFSAEQVERAGEFPERVNVPGYPESKFELPFTRRAKRDRARRRAPPRGR